MPTVTCAIVRLVSMGMHAALAVPTRDLADCANYRSVRVVSEAVEFFESQRVCGCVEATLHVHDIAWMEGTESGCQCVGFTVRMHVWESSSDGSLHAW